MKKYFLLNTDLLIHVSYYIVSYCMNTTKLIYCVWFSIFTMTNHAEASLFMYEYIKNIITRYPESPTNQSSETKNKTTVFSPLKVKLLCSQSDISVEEQNAQHSF